MDRNRKILVVQHVACEGPGVLGAAAREAGLEILTIRPPTLAIDGRAAGLIVLGGPMGVYEQDRHPWIREELAMVRGFVDAEKPVLGICLGSQVLAAALGARVYPHTRKEIGWAPIELSPAAADDPLLSGLESFLTPFHWHGDTFDLPANAVHLARSGMSANQIFRFGRAAWGFQCHFEVERQDPSRWAEVYRDEVCRENAPTVGSDFEIDTGTWWPRLQPAARRIADRFCRLCLDS